MPKLIARRAWVLLPLRLQERLTFSATETMQLRLRDSKRSSTPSWSHSAPLSLPGCWHHCGVPDRRLLRSCRPLIVLVSLAACAGEAIPATSCTLTAFPVMSWPRYQPPPSTGACHLRSRFVQTGAVSTQRLVSWPTRTLGPCSPETLRICALRHSGSAMRRSRSVCL